VRSYESATRPQLYMPSENQANLPCWSGRLTALVVPLGEALSSRISKTRAESSMFKLYAAEFVCNWQGTTC
jgi:hypothetical protein